MIDRHIAMLGAGTVLIDHHKARAVYKLLRTQPLGNALCDMRFSNTKFTKQNDKIAASESLSNALADSYGLCRAVTDEIDHMWRLYDR